MFSLSKSVDVENVAHAFRAQGRVEIRHFLGPGEAELLRAHLLERDDWILVLNAGEQVYEIPRSDFEDLSQSQRRELEQKVVSAARGGFQYRYESVRVADDDAGRQINGTILDRFIQFMSSQPVVEMLSQIVDRQDVDFADGQATSYSPGDFLTGHDDNVSGKNRRAAYVLGLSPKWRAEWGGLLMFHGQDGNIEEAFVPAMGALRLFAVPQLHSVSYVTPMAAEPRLSVTGWLRAARDA